MPSQYRNPRHNNDLRHMDTAGRERSKLAVKVMDFVGKELKEEWHNRVSETDLRHHLERQGMARDMVRRVITVTVKHLSEKDYDGIKKVVNQIPLAYFEPPPQASGSSRASVAHTPVVTTQSKLPKASNHSRNTLPSSRTSSSQKQNHHCVNQQGKGLSLSKALTSQAKRQSPSQKKILQVQKIQDQDST